MSDNSKIMVCVTRQKTCERLIKFGENIANSSHGSISVIHVAKVGVKFLGNPDEGEALDYLFQISKQAGADMTVIRSDNVLESLISYAKSNDITDIILGDSPESASDSNIIKSLKQSLPNIRFNIIPA